MLAGNPTGSPADGDRRGPRNSAPGGPGLAGRGTTRPHLPPVGPARRGRLAAGTHPRVEGRTGPSPRRLPGRPDQRTHLGAGGSPCPRAALSLPVVYLPDAQRDV